MAGEFGPSALATPANAVTVTRLVAAPLLLLLLLDQHTSWVAIAAWAILAGTDGVDGWLARRHGTTRSGAFLDPLADKFLVFAAMIAQYLIDGRRGRLGQAADEPTSPLARLGADVDAAAARLVEAGAAPVLNRLVDADPAPTATPRPAHPAGA
jgi:hypothetical protein